MDAVAAVRQGIQDKIHELVLTVGPRAIRHRRPVEEPDIFVVFALFAEFVAEHVVGCRAGIQGRQVIACHQYETVWVDLSQREHMIGERSGTIVELLDRAIRLGVRIQTLDLYRIGVTCNVDLVGQVTIDAENIVEERLSGSDLLFDMREVLFEEIAIEEENVLQLELQIGVPGSGIDGREVDLLKSQRLVGLL